MAMVFSRNVDVDRRYRSFWLGLCLLVLIGLGMQFSAGTAEAAWKEPIGGASPINFQANQSAGSGPSVTVWKGQPYAAWSENDGDNQQIRVKRFDGTSWITVGSNQINYSNAAGMHATQPTVASSGNLLMVAWVEYDGTNKELRAASYSADSNLWSPTGGDQAQASPINLSNAQDANDPSLTFMSNAAVPESPPTPVLAWTEFDGVNREVRVSIYSSFTNKWIPLVVNNNVSSPINFSNAKNGLTPTVRVYASVVYVAWSELDNAGNYQIRVSKFTGNGTTGWGPVDAVNPGSPINNSSQESGATPDLLTVPSGPAAGLYVAWSEPQPNFTAGQIRVSRLSKVNGVDKFIQVIGGSSPINYLDNMHAQTPSLAEVGGAVYVSWTEADQSGAYQVRVAKLDEVEGHWQYVVAGQKPINANAGTAGLEPNLFSLGGIPYVSWREGPIPYQVRTSRLEPEFLDSVSSPTDSGALLMQKVKTYGVAYPFRFAYGPGDGFGSQSNIVTSSGSTGTDTVLFQPTNLASSTKYSWKAFSSDGLTTVATGPTGSFTTLAPSGSGSQGDSGGKEGAAGQNGSTGSAGGSGVNGQNGIDLIGQKGASGKLKVAFLKRAVTAKAGRKLSFKYSLSGAATVKLEIKKGSKAVARVTKKLTKGGKFSIAWNGKIKKKKARKGSYKAVITASSGTQKSTDQAKLKLKK